MWINYKYLITLFFKIESWSVLSKIIKVNSKFKFNSGNIKKKNKKTIKTNPCEYDLGKIQSVIS